ncbi:MAG TPA: trehalose-phosphatase [Thermoanaerobaculia bacterium]|nr:trehalose-phosphatase [Thermoanaerobaculia bacterium]
MRARGVGLTGQLRGTAPSRPLGGGGSPPSALDQRQALQEDLRGRRPAFFLDYDGTLTAIVERPEDAVLSEAMRRVLRQLSRRFPVAVVSGRDRRDVARRVGLPELWYAGSHGYDIAGPGGEITFQPAEPVVPRMAGLAVRLAREVGGIAGAQVEPKRFTVAVHYRRAAPADVPRVEEVVNRTVSDHPELRKTSGKKVWEIRPALDWDKGRAVLWLLDALDLDHPGVAPVYVGDDETDEDAFRALRDRGIGILVTDVPRPTAARYRLAGPQEVGEWLAAMADG